MRHILETNRPIIDFVVDLDEDEDIDLFESDDNFVFDDPYAELVEVTECEFAKWVQQNKSTPDENVSLIETVSSPIVPHSQIVIHPRTRHLSNQFNETADEYEYDNNIKF